MTLGAENAGAERTVHQVGRAAVAVDAGGVGEIDADVVEHGAGFDEAEAARLLNVYRLVSFMDTHITENDFPGFDEALETLITHFVKGVFA